MLIANLGGGLDKCIFITCNIKRNKKNSDKMQVFPMLEWPAFIQDLAFDLTDRLRC